MTDKTWYCYLARCRDGSLYAGITMDLNRREEEHNEGRGARYTRSRRPVTLVWWEPFGTKSAALKREAEVKKWRKSCKEKLAMLPSEPMTQRLRPRRTRRSGPPKDR